MKERVLKSGGEVCEGEGGRLWWVLMGVGG